MCVYSVTQSCLTRLYGLQPAKLHCPWNFPGNSTAVGYHLLLQGIFLSWVLNLHLLCLLHWRVGSLPLWVCICQSYSKKDSVLQSPSLGSLSHRKFPSAIYLHMLVYMHPCYFLPLSQGGRFKREGTYVPLWLIHVDVCQKSNQYCKPIISQLKKKIFFFKGLCLQLSW